MLGAVAKQRDRGGGGIRMSHRGHNKPKSTRKEYRITVRCPNYFELALHGEKDVAEAIRNYLKRTYVDKKLLKEEVQS